MGGFGFGMIGAVAILVFLFVNAVRVLPRVPERCGVPAGGGSVRWITGPACSF